MRKDYSYRDFDWVLLGLVSAISAIGVLQIYSTTIHTKFAGAHTRQFYWILFGIVLLVIFSFWDYHDILNHAPTIYFVTLILLLVVLVVGTHIFGAKRWIRVGGLSIQISEPMKLVLILLLARFFSDTPRDGVSLHDVIKVAAVVGAPALLILLQPDLGTALTLFPIALAMLFLAGLQLRYFGYLILAAILMIPIAVHHMKPYQRARITSFLDPENDPKASGYQLLQSKIAVGSGQMLGKGLAQGTQTQLWFLPVPHTDFIFAAFSEEHGFIGAITGLLLYMFVLLRLLYNAQTASDMAGTYLVTGVAAVLFFQVLVNVGMVIGFVPVTGIPLPLMSYGGTSILFMYTSIGVVNSIRIRRFVN